MTTPTKIDPNGYAVVYFGDGDTPVICTGMSNGLIVDGKTYAIYDSADSAVDEFVRWPHLNYGYGILPVRMLLEEQPRYILKKSATYQV